MTTKTKKTAARKTTKIAAKGPAPKAKTATEKPSSMWGVAREMIIAGKSNAEVLDALKAQFKLPPEHEYYPRWYRAHAVMKGLVTKAFARDHAGPRAARKPATA